MQIIERFVKNDTPYLGRLVVRLEKNPYYKSTKKGFLNKIHFDFKFFKIVTRIIPDIKSDKLIIDQKKVALIEKYTGGIIKEFRSRDNDYNTLITKHNFLTTEKKMVGDIFKGWFYFKNQMVVVNENPKNLALIYKNKIPFGYLVMTNNIEILVKLGDRIFDEKYKPSMADYQKKEWKKWFSKYISDFNRTKDIKIKNDGVFKYIPYNMRGLRKIKNFDEAKMTAMKIINYIEKFK